MPTYQYTCTECGEPVEVVQKFTDEPLTVTAKMREKPVEDFFARNGRLREDNLMVHDLMLVQVKTPEESNYPWDYYNVLTTISGDDAFGPPDPACPMVKK